MRGASSTWLTSRVLDITMWCQVSVILGSCYKVPDLQQVYIHWHDLTDCQKSYTQSIRFQKNHTFQQQNYVHMEM